MKVGNNYYGVLNSMLILLLFSIQCHLNQESIKRFFGWNSNQSSNSQNSSNTSGQSNTKTTTQELVEKLESTLQLDPTELYKKDGCCSENNTRRRYYQQQQQNGVVDYSLDGCPCVRRCGCVKGGDLKNHAEIPKEVEDKCGCKAPSSEEGENEDENNDPQASNIAEQYTLDDYFAISSKRLDVYPWYRE